MPPPYDVVLMADYGVYLWSNSLELQRLRQPVERFAERLGVSGGLIARLEAWELGTEFEVSYRHAAEGPRSARQA